MPTGAKDNSSFCRKYCLHRNFPSNEFHRLFNTPAILLSIIYIYTIVSYVIRHAYPDNNGNIQYCEAPSLILAICQIVLYIVCIIIAIMYVYDDILKFKESMIFCGFPWFFLFVTNIVDAKRIGGCQFFQVVIDLLGYFTIFYLWSSKPHPVSGLFCVILHITFMCLIIVLTDHTNNNDVVHFLIGLSEEVLLFELLHHGWDSYRDGTEQTPVPPNDNHMDSATNPLAHQSTASEQATITIATEKAEQATATEGNLGGTRGAEADEEEGTRVD